jgi:chorismate mutase
MKELTLLRQEIDDLDDQIVELLSKRFGITNEIGRLKAKHSTPALDQDRENRVISRLGEKALSLSLNPELVASIFSSILAEVVSEHNKLLKQGGGS